MTLFNRRSCCSRVLIAPVLGFLALGANAEMVETRLPSGDVLELSIPPDWHIKRRSNSIRESIYIYASSSEETATLLVVLVELAPESPVRSASDVKALVDDQGTNQLPWAVQGHLETTTLDLDDGTAYYYHLTARGAGDDLRNPREQWHGAALLSGHFVGFFVWTHPGELSKSETALQIIASARVVLKD